MFFHTFSAAVPKPAWKKIVYPNGTTHSAKSHSIPSAVRHSKIKALIRKAFGVWWYIQWRNGFAFHFHSLVRQGFDLPTERLVRRNTLSHKGLEMKALKILVCEPSAGRDEIFRRRSWKSENRGEFISSRSQKEFPQNIKTHFLQVILVRKFHVKFYHVTFVT